MNVSSGISSSRQMALSDGVARPSPDLTRLTQAVCRQVYQHDPEYQQFGPTAQQVATPAHQHMHNYWFSTTGQATRPAQVFEKLYWGGQFIYVCSSQKEATSVQRAFEDKGGFVIEKPLQRIASRVMGLRLPGLSQKGWFFSARKLLLLEPGQGTNRFTYHVQLAKNPKAPFGYVVLKEVPTLDYVAWRIKEKHPDLPQQDIIKRARKLVETVFPIFLTRETAILNILRRNLPEAYRHRIPKVLGFEKDDQGFVRRLYLNWMRQGGPLLTQLDFAIQSADLLQQLHHVGKVIHLDLRLDNFVISNGQVGFVDFGSAVRDGENLDESSMLRSLFNEMMRTSQIQRLLGKWKESGRLTSKVISEHHLKIDHAIDFFYLAVQMNRPHHKPEFQDQILFNKNSEEAAHISQLTASIMRPKNQDHPPYRGAQDILQGLLQIQQKLTDTSKR